MNYKLVKSSFNDINRLKKYKKDTIFAFAKNLDKDEVDRINDYIDVEVEKNINNYFNIVVNDVSIGCLLINDHEDGKILDEIYLEEEYRSKNIGSHILSKLVSKYKKIYLWVYKENIKAIKLYEKYNFKIIDETESRYYMKYSRI